MNRVWIPTVAVMACVIVGVELDHEAQREHPAGATQAASRVSSDDELQVEPSGAVCAWSAPGADDLPAPALLSTVRLADGATLHRVTCSDGWSGWQWLRDPRSAG